MGARVCVHDVSLCAQYFRIDAESSSLSSPSTIGVPCSRGADFGVRFVCLSPFSSNLLFIFCCRIRADSPVLA